MVLFLFPNLGGPMITQTGIPFVMTVEINGQEFDLTEGINGNSGIKLPPGMTRLKIKSDGIVAFHYSHEVMG